MKDVRDTRDPLKKCEKIALELNLMTSEEIKVHNSVLIFCYVSFFFACGHLVKIYNYVYPPWCCGSECFDLMVKYLFFFPQEIKKAAAKTAEEAVEFARSSPAPAPSELFTHILVDQNEVVRGCDPFTTSHSS